MHKVRIDFSRWPEEQPGLARVRQLQDHKVDLVLDIGANDGGYARECRIFGYRGRIVSFEPLAAPRMRLRTGKDADWAVLPYAIGDRDGDIDINVAGNGEASSSALAMLDTHRAAAPESRFVSVERCPVRRLDSIWSSLVGQSQRAFLKIDVQGYERAVLDGAQEVLDIAVGLQIEVSLVPLYEGGMLYGEALSRLLEQGFEVARIDGGFTNKRTGRMLQADVTLYRA
jgi:FkbM family methyltransferase